ncbi:MAG: PD-(D/E)XK nuclease-like domain-containing protein [Candidatus Contendobacter sp.]|nr:PD-(D/E)XK nuclease-like domain-containing protein [Candidatus Contendobacter sp.]MDG4558872.1 PD-(D/E)XK nuclease-like domain-containing protein [Candidatus Contendobacter sp.]
MNNADYQDLPGISSHWLIAMLDNPATCWRKYLDPQRPAETPTDAMRFGTLVHCLALTPRQLEREFLVADYERRSNAGKARYAQLQQYGLTVIRPAELDRARAMVAALHADPEARKLLRGGKKERTIIQPRARGWLPLKARLDVHQESKRQVVELKTIRDLGLVKTTMARYRYPLSAEFYRNMVRGQSVVFVFVQSTPPHEILILPMSRIELQDGEMMWRTALEMFDTCWRINQWPEMNWRNDDDPLMMDFMPPKAAGRSPRFELQVGEVTL